MYIWGGLTQQLLFTCDAVDSYHHKFCIWTQQPSSAFLPSAEPLHGLPMSVNAYTSKRVGTDRTLPDAHRLYASSCNPGRDSKTLHRRWWCHIDSIAEVDNQVLQVHTMYQREGRQAISCHPAQIAFAWTGRCPYYSSTTERQSRGCMTPLCWPGCPWQIFPAHSLSCPLNAS